MVVSNRRVNNRLSKGIRLLAVGRIPKRFRSILLSSMKKVNVAFTAGRKGRNRCTIPKNNKNISSCTEEHDRSPFQEGSQCRRIVNSVEDTPTQVSTILYGRRGLMGASDIKLKLLNLEKHPPFSMQPSYVQDMLIGEQLAHYIFYFIEAW